MRTSTLLATLAAAIAAAPAGCEPQLDRALDDFWSAGDPAAAAAAAAAVLATGASFEEVRERLLKGRAYARDVATGRLDMVRSSADGVKHHYRVLVPRTYDPEKRYPVRVYLHGSISREPWTKGGRWWPRYEPFEHPERIAVFPSAWRDSMWWQASQVDNLAAILDRLKRTYNVDENRVHLFGISDGASGAYFQAFRHPTPWAAFLPFIGHPAVLGNLDHRADGQIHVRNLANRAFFVVNGGRDPVYDMRIIRAYLELFRKSGAEIDFHPRLEASHDTRWWPVERQKMEAFIAAHPRDPLPDRLVWETERVDRYQRLHWLVVTGLDPDAGEGVFAPLDRLEAPAAGPAYPRTRPSGIVELERRGNLVRARTRGVSRYLLLLSPEDFDFLEPVRVETDGTTSFEGRVEPDVGTLLRWAARDGDRTMLFAAELEIEVEP